MAVTENKESEDGGAAKVNEQFYSKNYKRFLEHRQKKLDKLTSSELTTEIAAEIVKTNIQNKFKDLSADEVDLLFYDQLLIPHN